MRTSWPLLVVIAFFSGNGSAQETAAAESASGADLITDDFDRFTGKRTISFKSKEKPQNQKPMVNLMATFNGDTLEQGLMVLSLFNVSTGRGPRSSWLYLRCHNVYWLVDGEPFSLGDSNHHGDTTPRGGLTELITQFVSAEDFGRLASASSIEYKICNDEFSATSTDVSGIRAVSHRVSELLQAN